MEDDPDFLTYGVPEDETVFFEPERNAFERVGLIGAGESKIKTATFIEGEGKKIGKDAVSADDRFIHFLDAMLASLVTEGYFTADDKDLIIEKTTYLGKLRYRNPFAYALGYIASNAGKDITKKSVDRALKILKQEKNLREEYGVEVPDVIRYARVWKLLL
jgi:hypothetical protein